MTPSCPPEVRPLPEAQPLRFDAAEGWCFGWFHPARAPVRDLAVVLCRPLGYEAMCSYAAYVQLARTLADAGLCVLRFDYHGTGDSAGDDNDPCRVGAWLASVEAAMGEARRRSGASEVALVGVRMGATLAAAAAARAGGVDSLVLWAPCASGRAFLRELRASGSAEPDAGLRAFGYSYAAQTLQDLAALDCAGLAQAPARRAWVIGRDDLPSQASFLKTWRSAGVDATASILPGYAAMMRDPSDPADPRDGDQAQATHRALTAWLLASPAAQRARQAAPHAAAAAPPASHRTHAGVRETSLTIGWAGPPLFGVLAEPVRPLDERRHQTAVLLLNVGGNYRAGPHRLYVTAARALAAQGYRVLRFDLDGIGDSAGPGSPPRVLYGQDPAREVRAAVDALAQQGCREFVLMGVCSGSYVAFQTALAEPRVSLQILLNSRLLEPAPPQRDDLWQSSMQQYLKSSDYYLRALWQPRVYWRIARGEVHLAAIARRLAGIARARLQRTVGHLLQRAGEDSVLARMRQLCAAGTGTLMLISAQDDGRDYVEFHLGREGRYLRRHRNFRFVLVPDADHTFSGAASQQFVIGAVSAHLNGRPGPQTPDAAPAREAGAPPVWAGTAGHGG